MKRIILFSFVIVCLCAGCSRIQPHNTNVSNMSSSDLTTEAPIEYGITHDAYENWEKDQPSDYLQDDLVKTEEIAIEIANTIVKNAVGEQEWERLYLTNVWEDVDRGVWVISYCVQSEDDNTFIVGGGVNLAIRKHDAQVVKMWAEE